MKAVVDIYLRLRAEGMIVGQLRTDCAGEFRSAALAEWCMQRAILHTYTSGDQPQANGRAEQSVGEVKSGASLKGPVMSMLKTLALEATWICDGRHPSQMLPGKCGSPFERESVLLQCALSRTTSSETFLLRVL